MSNIKNTVSRVLVLVEDLGLLVIALATVVAMGFEIKLMLVAAKVTLADLLLLFIYLEVLAMVGIYMRSGKLPVRMPLYIAMVAIARYMILDMKNLDTIRVLGLTGGVLILAIAILALRYGHTKFPYEEKENM